MAVKRSAGTKKTERTQKTTASASARTASAPAAAAPAQAPTKNSVWTLPISMVMLVLAAGAFWMAMRESSNTSQAATPAATSAVMKADDKAAETPTAPASAAKSATAPAEPAKTQDAPRMSDAKPVSVTGCLQRTDRGFTLKDTEGADAPRSRSWKSGFLKRNTASVSLTDSGNGARLADHVGQRVTVTGPMTDREMRVAALHRVSSSCQ